MNYKHQHIGPAHVACSGCYTEAQQMIREEDRFRCRFWRWTLVGFSLALACVAAVVLWKLGSLGR